MKRGLAIGMAVVALGTGVLLSAQSARSADVQMKAAQQKAEAEGDLKGAIEEYKKVVASAGTNRALAAQALLRIAECYQKLGDVESKRIYERLVRDYADQKDAVGIARARLGGRDAVARSMSERRVPIDLGEALLGKVSADGRFLSYLDRATKDVALHDLTAGTDRVLSKGDPSDPFAIGGYTAISRDGKQVAFNVHRRSSREIELHIAKVQGSDAPEVRRVLALGYDQADEIAPFDWSPDGRWLAVRVLRPGFTSQVALVSVRDGALRVLKSIEWGNTRNIFFSPDSRYIAYNLPIAGTRNDSHVFVMAIDGSRERAVVEHSSQNIIMGWSPDGASLLFASDRDGSFRLWTLPVNDGQSRGTPALVNTDVMGWDPLSLGVTASGALYVWKFTTNMYMQVAPIDLNKGTLLSDPGGGFRVFVGSGGKPTWSADGKHLAYRSCPLRCSRTGNIQIRTMDTDQVRELPMRLQYLQDPADLAWSLDGRSLIVFATDLKGRRGNYRIDAQTGETSPESSDLGPDVMTNVTTDGSRLYAAVGGSIVERDLASRKDRVVFQEKAPGNTVVVNSSPDRRYTAFIETAGTKMSTLFIMPYGGGEPRELLRATALDQFGRNVMTWTPDSRAILLIKANGQRKELWLVPISDGAPRKLDIDVDNWQVGNITGGFKLRPDGRQIAFVAGENKAEIRVIENFLPASSTAAPR